MLTAGLVETREPVGLADMVGLEAAVRLAVQAETAVMGVTAKIEGSYQTCQFDGLSE
ncbi:hypothetical protein ALP00_01946 [Pseudomonas coronafaciens pv. porri]|nr:hypothetical protein ALP00_01946 [Pseudomonas coronafaciens pv. porri]